MNAGLRNSFVFGPWTLEKVSPRFDLSRVDCGDPDLNEYFQKNSEDYPKAPTIPLFFDLLRIETSAA